MANSDRDTPIEVDLICLCFHLSQSERERERERVTINSHSVSPPWLYFSLFISLPISFYPFLPFSPPTPSHPWFCVSSPWLFLSLLPISFPFSPPLPVFLLCSLGVWSQWMSDYVIKANVMFWDITVITTTVVRRNKTHTASHISHHLPSWLGVSFKTTPY